MQCENNGDPTSLKNRAVGELGISVGVICSLCERWRHLKSSQVSLGAVWSWLISSNFGMGNPEIETGNQRRKFSIAAVHIIQTKYYLFHHI